MNIIALLSLVFVVPLTLLVVYLILSTCLGDRLRARLQARDASAGQAYGRYGKTYTRNFGSSMHQGGWEQIEMENMLEPEVESDDSS